MKTQGAVCYAIGFIVMLIAMILYTARNMQNSLKTGMMVSFLVLGFVCALLSLVPNKAMSLVFAVLSLILPILVVFFLGGLLLVLGIVQGLQSMSVLLFTWVLGGMIALAGSVLLLVT
jgi:hypothetical protein